MPTELSSKKKRTKWFIKYHCPQTDCQPNEKNSEGYHVVDSQIIFYQGYFGDEETENEEQSTPKDNISNENDSINSTNQEVQDSNEMKESINTKILMTTKKVPLITNYFHNLGWDSQMFMC